MKNVRIFFSKTGRAIYISHLDLYRLFQRAVKRCGLPLWETQGFNPHVYITFALPLALGTAGLCESLDARLTDDDMSFDEVCRILGAVMPEDIKILRAAEPVHDPADIERSYYEADFECDPDSFDEFLSGEHIITEKKTKRGMTQLDLKEHLEIKEKSPGHLGFFLPSGTQFNINAGLLFDAFEKRYDTEMGILNIKRRAVYCKNGEIFV